MYQRPNEHVGIFRRHWSLILGCFFPVSILNRNKLYVHDNDKKTNMACHEGIDAIRKNLFEANLFFFLMSLL